MLERVYKIRLDAVSHQQEGKMHRLAFIAVAMLLAAGGMSTALAHGGGGAGAGPGAGHGGQGGGIGIGHAQGLFGPPASLSAIARGNGPLSLDRDHGIERAEDRMSAKGLENTNGPMSPNRSKGTVRANQRHAQHALSKAGRQKP